MENISAIPTAKVIGRGAILLMALVLGEVLVVGRLLDGHGMVIPMWTNGSESHVAAEVYFRLTAYWISIVIVGSSLAIWNIQRVRRAIGWKSTLCRRLASRQLLSAYCWLLLAIIVPACLFSVSKHLLDNTGGMGGCCL